MDRKAQLIEVFHDTEKWYQEDKRLVEAVGQSIAGTKVYGDDEYPLLSAKKSDRKTVITVTKMKYFGRKWLQFRPISGNEFLNNH